MIVRKCDFKGCEKAGICRCPKDRSLKDYWHFCQKHAAEYNKNWNYYAGMSAMEIEKEWEKDMFGDAAERGGMGADYQKLVADFLHGKTKMPAKTIPRDVSAAFVSLGLSAADSWDKVQRKYRSLAKESHRDTGKTKDQSRFIKISNAYQTLKKHFGK